MKKKPSKRLVKGSKLRDRESIRRSVASILNGLISIGFIGLGTVIYFTVQSGSSQGRSSYSRSYSRNQSDSDIGIFSTFTIYAAATSTALIFFPMIPLVLFCMPKCPSCGEKFTYPQYTSEPDECPKCNFLLVKKKH